VDREFITDYSVFDETDSGSMKAMLASREENCA
jgi:hypothetical protein